MPGRSLFLSMTALLAFALVASCGEPGKPQLDAGGPKPNAISREYRRGPFCVRLLADKDSLSIAETVLLTIEAEVEEGYEADPPRFGEKLGEFGIRDYREEPPRLTSEKKMISKKVYTLEPFLSGNYRIAPMQVRFRKQRDTGTADENGTGSSGSWQHELSTEEITIRVNSLLENDQKELALNPIKGPVSLPAEPISLLVVLVGLGAAGLAGGVAFLLWRRKRATSGPREAEALPAHELAYRQLQEILEEKLIERGERKVFFSKLSDIVRGYIENRFGIEAPKRTTEEFLTDIRRDAPFSDEHRGLLEAFLRECDQVKFAEHSPSPGEITRAIDSCKAFIEATRADAVGALENERETRRHGEREEGGTRREGRGDAESRGVGDEI